MELKDVMETIFSHFEEDDFIDSAMEDLTNKFKEEQEKKETQ